MNMKVHIFELFQGTDEGPYVVAHIKSFHTYSPLTREATAPLTVTMLQNFSERPWKFIDFFLLQLLHSIEIQFKKKKYKDGSLIHGSNCMLFVDEM